MAKSKFKNTINIQVGTSYALRKTKAGVNAAAQEGENLLIDILSIPPTRSGVKYSGNPNVSAADGEAPAPQTGLLRQGVGHEPAQIRGKQVSSTVGTRGVQAQALEFGTEKMAPKPSVGKLRDDPGNRDKLKKAFIAGARNA